MNTTTLDAVVDTAPVNAIQPAQSQRFIALSKLVPSPMNVRTRMDKHIAVVEVLALQVPSRFIVDLVHADESVRRSRETVERWAGYQAQREG